MKCDQLMDAKRRCEHAAIERFVWPGKLDWVHVCRGHGAAARRVAAVMGVVLRFDEVPELGTPSPDDSCPVCGNLREVVGFCGFCEEGAWMRRR